MKKNKINDEPELTDVQKSILATRKRMNRRELEADRIEPFSKYKTITYIFLFLFPPYALYRIWKQDSPFRYGEKLFYSFVCVMYLVALINNIIQLI